MDGAIRAHKDVFTATFRFARYQRYHRIGIKKPPFFSGGFRYSQNGGKLLNFFAFGLQISMVRRADKRAAGGVSEAHRHCFG
ncbi:hypothetical protein CYJ97_00130, partial [Morganella morganii]